MSEWTFMFCSTRFLGLYYHHLHHKFSCFAGDHGFCWYGFFEIIMWFLWHCQVYAVPLGGMCVRQRLAIGGSGSTYVYGYVDSHVSDVKTKKECLEFVTNSTYLIPKKGKICYRGCLTCIEYISLQIVFTTACLCMWLEILLCSDL